MCWKLESAGVTSPNPGGESKQHQGGAVNFIFCSGLQYLIIKARFFLKRYITIDHGQTALPIVPEGPRDAAVNHDQMDAAPVLLKTEAMVTRVVAAAFVKSFKSSPLGSGS